MPKLRSRIPLRAGMLSTLPAAVSTFAACPVPVAVAGDRGSASGRGGDAAAVLAAVTAAGGLEVASVRRGSLSPLAATVSISLGEDLTSTYVTCHQHFRRSPGNMVVAQVSCSIRWLPSGEARCCRRLPPSPSPWMTFTAPTAAQVLHCPDQARAMSLAAAERMQRRRCRTETLLLPGRCKAPTETLMVIRGATLAACAATPSAAPMPACCNCVSHTRGFSSVTRAF